MTAAPESSAKGDPPEPPYDDDEEYEEYDDEEEEGEGKPGILSFENMAMIAACLALIGLPVAFAPDIVDAFRMPKQAVLVMLAALGLVGAAVGGYRIHPSPTFRYLLVAIVVFELLAFVFAFDQLTAILGEYKSRLGLVTQLSLLALLLVVASAVRRERDTHILGLFGLVGFAATAVYAIIQRLGHDPVSWSSLSVFSMLGNQNEYASYLVLCLAFIPALMVAAHRGGQFAASRFGSAKVMRFFPLAALLLFVFVLETGILWTQSRMGLLSFGGALAGVAVFAWFGGWQRTTVVRTSAAVLAVLVVGVLVGIPSGDSGTIWSRFGKIAPRADAQGDQLTDSLSIRQEIWKGSFAVVTANPLFGVGQEGTRLAFDRERPADLGGRFAELSPTGVDPGVDSPHTFLLEIPAQLGIPGALVVAAFCAWLSWRFWALLRRGRRSIVLPFVGGASFGFLLYAAVNPLTLPTLGIMAVLFGIVVGLDNRAKEPTLVRMPALRVVASAAAGLLVIAGIALALVGIASEVKFAQARRVGISPQGLDYSDQAARTMPFVAAYRRQQVEFERGAGVATGQCNYLRAALQNEEKFLDDFKGLALDYLWLAELRQYFGDPTWQDAIKQARAASPYGINTAATIAKIEKNAANKPPCAGVSAR